MYINDMNPVGLLSQIILILTASFLLTGFDFHQEKKAALIGPNCWNAALVANGVLQHHRYVNDKEFAFYMKSPLCRALNNSEIRITGDIGSISLKSKIPRGADGVEHAFVFFNDNLIYSKKNPLPQHPFKLGPINDLQDSFTIQFGSSCFFNRSHPNCKQRTTFYRCHDLDSYLNSQSDLSSVTLQSLKAFQEIELQIESLVMRNVIDTDSVLKNIKSFKIDVFNQSATDTFVYQILRLRTESIIDQLRALKEDYPKYHQLLEPELQKLKQQIILQKE